MKQKLAVMLLAAGMAFSCAFPLAACNGNGDAPHEHVYVDGVCTECGAPEPQPTEGLVFTLSEDEMEYAVTRYRGAATEVYIPATYEGLPVTSIGMSAFQLCRSLTSVIIPDSITSIGEWAFSNCSNLTSITIPDSVTSIGMSAFQECSSLTSITIPDSVTSIELMAFYNCSSLTSITIPDSVTSIGSEAFSGCSSLTSINVSENNATYSGQDGILYNKAKTRIVHVPRAIQGEVTIAEGVTSIGEYAFSDCREITSITLPDSVTSIKYGAFSFCLDLASITIPGSVTRIGERAFENCNLSSITIPDSVTSIRGGAFTNCDNLTSVTFENTEGWSVEGERIGVTNPAQLA